MVMKISIIVFFCISFNLVAAQLKFGFYSETCSDAESIVEGVIKDHFSRDPSITAALLRMNFHDCFVRGCDASLLLDSPESNAEKDAGPNFSVRGYDIIDEAKTKLEEECPLTVSCSDIITLATRDAVALSGGPSYIVPTGRRDGFTSNANEVNLPGPSFSVQESLTAFTSKGLNLNDMVTLLGAHTVGITHCNFIRDRLFNFQGTGQPDPTMNPTLLSVLRGTCASTDIDRSINLDQGTGSDSSVDNSYYTQILNGNGVLKVDQNFADDGLSNPAVRQMASDGNLFQTNFANALIKMSMIEVLVGDGNGEIRQNCRVINSI